MSDVLFDLTRAPARDETDAILQLLAGDPVHTEARRRIVAAVVAVARANRGLVDPNQVRAHLTVNGELTVYSRVVGATINSLVAKDVLVHAGHVRCENTKRGRNGGKLLPRYRLTKWVSA